MGILFGKGEKVLFIGDSITDAKRREIELGVGYPRMVAGMLAARYPELGLEIVNMGIGGDTVKDLAARWETDVIAQKPDWVSVSVGANDMWNEKHVEPEEFEKVYGGLIERTKREGARFILMQTAGQGETEEDGRNARLKPYDEAIRRLAKRHGAVWVPIREAWRRVVWKHPGVKWTTDGVHPTAAGHGVMARAWLEAVGYEWL